MLRGTLGPGMVLIFAISQAFRDVYFANLFQDLDFFEVILLTFSIGTVIFSLVAFVRSPQMIVRLWRRKSDLLWCNATTAAAWISYFFALKHLEPAIVNTLFSGMGPLTILILIWFGVAGAGSAGAGRFKWLGYAGLILSMIALWVVVLGGHSGIEVHDLSTTLLGLGLATLSGGTITISHYFAKRLNDEGIGADAVMATRFIAIVAVAAAVEVTDGADFGIADPEQLLLLSAAALLLVVLPSFAVQLGIALSAPLTVNLIRSLGPVFLFALQQFDGRLVSSGATLGCVILYAVCVVGGTLGQAWSAMRARRQVARP